MKWRRKAAEQGYAGRQFNLGVIYDSGQGANLTMVHVFTKYADSGKDTRFLEPLIDCFGYSRVRDVTASAIRDATEVLYEGCKLSTWNRQVIVLD